MSDDLTLLFLGAPRTGTTSLFYMLRDHPNISTGKVKELFNRSKYRHIFPRKFLDEFKITSKTKILLDGTPSAYDFFYNQVSKIEINKKVIYPVRNPFDRMYSTVKQMIISYDRQRDSDVKYPTYIKKLDIRSHKLLKYFPSVMDSKHIKRALDVTDNVFIFRFDELDIKAIYNFLDIYPLDQQFVRYNAMDSWYDNDRFSFVRNKVNRFWEENKKTIAEIILDDLYKIQKYVDVGDWIIETENILSNV